MEIRRGMRDSLENYIDKTTEFKVRLSVLGNSVYDYSCFGLDCNGKLSDDRYMVFYNQMSSPKNEICYVQKAKEGEFNIRLSTLPASVDRLVFTVNIDGNGTMGMITDCSFIVKQREMSVLNMHLNGKDFSSEKAIILVEFYRKNGVWRFSAVARGFNGGLSELLKLYGGEEITPNNSASQQVININNNVQNTQKVSAPKKQGFFNNLFGGKSSVSESKKSLQNAETASGIFQQKNEKISLKKGQKISLTKSESRVIRIENGWTAKGKDYDLKALVRYRNGKLIYVGAANSDEVIMTSEGAVKHGGDIKSPGELEHIDIKWHPDIASVAVSSYSAIENGTGSFHRYGVFVRIINGKQIIEIPAADTSANERSYTLCFGEIIFGTEKDSFEVSALEMYSRPNSEHRIGYKKNKVVMDIGPEGKTK